MAMDTDIILWSSGKQTYSVCNNILKESGNPCPAISSETPENDLNNDLGWEVTSGFRKQCDVQYMKGSMWVGRKIKKRGERTTCCISQREHIMRERPLQILKSTVFKLLAHRSMVNGFSRNLRNSASHCAPTAPSTTRWSQLSVTDIMLATSNLRETQKMQELF